MYPKNDSRLALKFQVKWTWRSGVGLRDTVREYENALEALWIFDSCHIHPGKYIHLVKSG